MWQYFHKLSSPINFKKFARKCIAPLLFMHLILLLLGFYYIYLSPPDYQQGQMVKIMYIHVPSAWLSLGIYTFMAICSFISLVWGTRLCYIMAAAAAPIGACFAFITLATGSLWGKPIWGAWWVWDARLTSMLILFLLYISYISIIYNGNSLLRAEKPASVFAIIGFINIPIVKFSVDIWYSLHQGASVLRASGPAMSGSMLTPLLLIFAAFSCLFIFLLILRSLTIMTKLKLKLL